jgi:hypothetical protein
MESFPVAQAEDLASLSKIKEMAVWSFGISTVPVDNFNPAALFRGCGGHRPLFLWKILPLW